MFDENALNIRWAEVENTGGVFSVFSTTCSKHSPVFWTSLVLWNWESFKHHTSGELPPPSSELGQIRGLFLRYGRAFVMNISSTTRKICIVAGCPMTLSDEPMTHGVTMNHALIFEEYLNHVSTTCNFHIWGLHHIRRSISKYQVIYKFTKMIAGSNNY